MGDRFRRFIKAAVNLKNDKEMVMNRLPHKQ